MNDVRIALPGTPERTCRVRFCAGPRRIAPWIASVAGDARVFIVTDRTVDRIHGPRLRRALATARVDSRWLSVSPGERSKSRLVRDRLEDSLIRGGAERSSVVVAFGGGVVGDLAGFVAATLLRGVRFIQVPTTLIAQADSAVGGKTGIDHPLGKNLLGAFHQPEAVLTHTGYLLTLPEREFRQGLAEVVKTAFVLDASLVRTLEGAVKPVLRREREAMETVVARCCALKGRIVASDEREGGARRVLNFGHTVGHALEHASRFGLPHGFAVSIGMAVEAGIAHRLGLVDMPSVARLLRLLEAFGLPVAVPQNLPTGRILAAITVDKKRSGGTVGFTLMSGTGKAVCGVNVPEPVLAGALRR